MTGILFVLSAPAGTGKTTLMSRLLQVMPQVVRSVSATTRSPRPGEIDGVDYHFLSFEQFERERRANAFLECAQVFGHWYGTLRSRVEELVKAGKHVFLVIDTQGAASVKAKLDAVTIFVSPPSMEELQRRLQERGTECEQSLERRLEQAKRELEQASSYDYHIVNDDLDTAFEALCHIVIDESHHTRSETNSQT